jgi:hypothetical protein
MMMDHRKNGCQADLFAEKLLDASDTPWGTAEKEAGK